MPEGMQIHDPETGVLISDYTTRHGGILGTLVVNFNNSPGSYTIPNVPPEAEVWYLARRFAEYDVGFLRVAVSGHTISWAMQHGLPGHELIYGIY